MTRLAPRGPRKTAPGDDDFLEVVSTPNSKLPYCLVLHAQEGWGKTSLGAQFPNPIFLMTKGEKGLLTLINSGQLGPVQHFRRPAESWNEVKLATEWLINFDHPHKTFVIDTINGAERLMHEMVCHRDFNGEWGDKGFLAFQKGYDRSIPDWLDFLARLDRLREAKGMAILLLCHTAVRTFKNPEGPDFDRYEPAVHKSTWGVSHKWSDMVLFGKFETITEEKKGTRAKGIGGQQRLLMTTRHAAYDAKNRHGLPEEIDCGDSPEDAWSAFLEAMKGTK